ncbi:MAG: NRDE family protein [Deltaproteobacteria bacterium]|nr:NRDE family protein [Deltaproteobacteria bacterium]
MALSIRPNTGAGTGAFTAYDLEVCTVVLIHKVFEGRPIALVANRDELLDRPAAGPGAWAGSRIFAPRDLRAGGTWLGLNEDNVVVAITNRFGQRDDARRSRGELVASALRASSAREGARLMETVSARSYNGFHLLLADVNDAWLIYGDGESLVSRPLEPGAHVVTERSLGAGDPRREVFVRGELERMKVSTSAGLIESAAPALEDLLHLLSRHVDSEGRTLKSVEGVDPIASTCVHWPALNYGTRSSTAIELGSSIRVLHAEGPPCRTPYASLPVQFR